MSRPCEERSSWPLQKSWPSPDTKPPAFEVASVKPLNPDDQQVMMVAQPGGRFVARNIPLRLLIRTAYRLQDDQVVGGPKWLEVHHQTKELAIYALALARTDGALGSQLRRNDCERVLAAPDVTQPL
jgi:hypothetical protein